VILSPLVFPGLLLSSTVFLNFLKCIIIRLQCQSQKRFYNIATRGQCFKTFFSVICDTISVNSVIGATTLSITTLNIIINVTPSLMTSCVIISVVYAESHFTMLSFIMLSVVILVVNKLNVIMLSVMEPCQNLSKLGQKIVTRLQHQKTV
jgi:hypothetical protein